MAKHTQTICQQITDKQFVSKLPTNCLSVFDHFVKLVLKGLRYLGRATQTATFRNEN